MSNLLLGNLRVQLLLPDRYGCPSEGGECGWCFVIPLLFSNVGGDCPSLSLSLFYSDVVVARRTMAHNPPSFLLSLILLPLYKNKDFSLFLFLAMAHFFLFHEGFLSATEASSSSSYVSWFCDGGEKGGGISSSVRSVRGGGLNMPTRPGAESEHFVQ